ncbi:MAG: hypothetical protein JRI23_36215 [Deltaproteobacteria bacterium]|jgi:hypothetical protein|nr:hypothetical protein [Deltaproteobacteria bacterium]MBW2537795.1 hypothetical protein [Deltaproteobacteria bacterium]
MKRRVNRLRAIRVRWVVAAVALLGGLAWWSAGCSSEVTDDDDDDDGTTATGTGTGAGGSPESCERFVESAGEGRCPGLCRVLNEDSCRWHGTSVDCATMIPTAAVDACGLALPAPLGEGIDIVLGLQRSASVREHAGSGPPDLACLQAGAYPPPPDPGASQLVTLTGKVDIFANGCESQDVTIAVHTVKRTDGGDEADLDQLVGQSTQTASDCALAGVAEPGVLGCGADDTRWECTFSYPSVPTETELVVVTSGSEWTTVYEYGVFLRNAEVSGGQVARDLHVVAADDYATMAQAAMGRTVTPGHGVVLGEVHDCGDVRLQNAVAEVDVPKFVTTYFNDDESAPLPTFTAKTTSSLGLYAALDIVAGPVTAGAAGVLDEALLSLGQLRVRIHPDAVTWVTFAGPRPFVVDSSQ